MKHSLVSVELVDGRRITISPISLDAYEDNDAYALGDDSGYFVYEIDIAKESCGIEILAKAASYDAAVRLADIISATRLATTQS